MNSSYSASASADDKKKYSLWSNTHEFHHISPTSSARYEETRHHLQDDSVERKESQYHSHALSHGVDLLEQKDYPTMSYSYEVYFKCCNGTYVSNLLLQQGDYVIVEADRGCDIGVVNNPLPSPFDSLTLSSSAKILSKLDPNALSHDSDLDMNLDPNQTLPEMFLKKITLENKALIFARAVCYELNVTHLLNVIGTEFQFDRKRLTVYYQKLHPDASLCKLIRRLFATFKMRIWMENISIDTECENLNNMLSLFQPNVKRFLELTSLPLKQDDVYLFVPGLKESWSQYENNRDIRDENTELLFISPVAAPPVVAARSSVKDNEKKNHSNESVLSSSPTSSGLTMNHVLTATSHQNPQNRVSHTRLRDSSHSKSNNPKIHHPIGSNLAAASLLSAPYEPHVPQGIRNQQKKPPPFVPADYLQYQPSHIARGHLPPPPATQHFHFSHPPPPPNPTPIKLAHVPPESFYRIPYSSPSLSSSPSSSSSSSASSASTTPMHQPRAHYVRPHFDFLPVASHTSSSHGLNHPQKRQPSGKTDHMSHYLQPSPLSITAPAYSEDRNMNPAPLYRQQQNLGNSQEIGLMRDSYNFHSAPSKKSIQNDYHYPQLHHHEQYYSQPPTSSPDSRSNGRGAVDRGNKNLNNDYVPY